MCVRVCACVCVCVRVCACVCVCMHVPSVFLASAPLICSAPIPSFPSSRTACDCRTSGRPKAFAQTLLIVPLVGPINISGDPGRFSTV